MRSVQNGKKKIISDILGRGGGGEGVADYLSSVDPVICTNVRKLYLMTYKCKIHRYKLLLPSWTLPPFSAALLLAIETVSSFVMILCSHS